MISFVCLCVPCSVALSWSKGQGCDKLCVFHVLWRYLGLRARVVVSFVCFMFHVLWRNLGLRARVVISFGVALSWFKGQGCDKLCVFHFLWRYLGLRARVAILVYGPGLRCVFHVLWRYLGLRARVVILVYGPGL